MCSHTLLQPKHIANLNNTFIFDSLGKMYLFFFFSFSLFKEQNGGIAGRGKD